MGKGTWCHISRPELALSAQPCWSTKALLAAAVNHTPDAHSLCSCPAPHPEYRVNHLLQYWQQSAPWHCAVKATLLLALMHMTLELY